MKLWKIMLAVIVAVLMISCVAMADEHVHHFVKIEGSDVIASGYTCTTVNGQAAHSYTVNFQMKCDGCNVGYTDSRIDTVYCKDTQKKVAEVEATCNAKGYTEYACKVCAQTWTVDGDAATGKHAWAIDKRYEATCQYGSWSVSICTMCGKTHINDAGKDDPANRADHGWEWKKVSAGNCSTPATWAHKCKWCGVYKDGMTYADEKPSADHTWVKNEVKATCTSFGMMIRDCSVCDKHEEFQIDKLAHKADFTKPTVVKAPTCTEAGLTTYPCYMCNQDGMIKEYPAALGHSYVPHAYKAPTCGADGVENYYTCNRCTKIWAADQVTEISSIPVIPANKNGHIKPVGEKPVYTDCTATNNYYLYDCTVCHKEILEYIPASSHDFDTVEECIQKGNTGSAWCTTGDTVTVECSKCGVESSVKIPALGHKWGNWNYGKAATCTTELVAERWCARCSDGYEMKVIEEALGHNWILETGTDATCEKEGKGTRICARCKSKQLNVTIPAKGHSFTKTVETVKPTCDAQGYTVFGCANCDATQKGNYTAALGHNYSWVVVTKPSEAGNGKNEYTCAVCKKVADTKVVKYTKYYYNNTMTSFGPTTKELVGGNDWYRVTPVDLTVDGVYTYDLIASNKYVVGKVTIAVNAGTLTVSYKANGVDVKDEALLIYASKADLATGTAVTAPVGAAINAAETFGADTKVLVSLILTGDYDAAGKGLVDASAAAGMIANID